MLRIEQKDRAQKDLERKHHKELKVYKKELAS